MILILAACSTPAPDITGPADLPAASSDAPAPLRTACDGGAVLVGTGATFDSLQEALDAAGAGDIVAACAGTHHGPFVARAPITLGGVGEVVLDGGGAGPTITLPGGSTLLDLEVTGGRGEDGGGVRVSSPAEITLARVSLAGNVATNGGGLWAPPGAIVRLYDTTIAENLAQVGGGLRLEGGELHAEGVTFARNDARDGGAVAARGSWLGLGDAVLRRNTAENGGAVYADTSTVDGGVFTANVAGTYGGAVALIEAELEGAQLADNGAAFGGGVYVLAGAIGSSVLERNTAENGAGIYAVAGVTLVDTWVLDHDGVGLAVGIDRADVIGGAFVGNRIGAESSGGLGQVLTSEGTDWGTDRSDNTYDVAWSSDAFEFGSNATFTCAGAACEP